MYISEILRQLEKIKNGHGDMEVRVPDLCAPLIHPHHGSDPIEMLYVDEQNKICMISRGYFLIRS